MIYLIGFILSIQIYMLGYTYYLPKTIFDTSFQFLFIIQYLAIGCTIGYLFKSYKKSKMLTYCIISIPLLFFASFRWIFLNDFLISLIDKIVSRNVIDILFVHRINEVSWMAIGGLLYLIVATFIVKPKKNEKEQ